MGFLETLSMLAFTAYGHMNVDKNTSTLVKDYSWVLSSESLPKERQPVLAYSQKEDVYQLDYFIYVASKNPELGPLEPKWVHTLIDNDWEVSHWMPLPNPPEYINNNPD